jgi:hypothetical protein
MGSHGNCNLLTRPVEFSRIALTHAAKSTAFSETTESETFRILAKIPDRIHGSGFGGET